MSQLQILQKARNELREIRKILKTESAETMGQIVGRLVAAELKRLQKV